jgi:hypothetical protein
MTHTEIVKKLIGNINPQGCSTRDEESFQNLKLMCELAQNLLIEIDNVYYKNRHSQEFSVKRASDYAGEFLEGVKN